MDAWKARCPITLAAARLRARGGLDDAGLASMEDTVRAEVDDAVAFAEAGTWEPVESLARFVSSEAPVP